MTDSERDHRIAQLCEEAIGERTFPGCQVGYIRHGRQKLFPFGRLTYEADAPAVTERTMYDVASITKSIPTSSLVLKLVSDGRLSLEDTVISFIPEVTNEFREKILIRHLLTFTVMFDLRDSMANVAKDSPDRLLEAIFTAPLAAPPGEKYTYTNAPSLLLGIIAERVYAKKLDEAAQEVFFGPLGMHRTTFHTEAVPSEELAPTATDWRGEVRGRVHDPGAWALYHGGRVPGHAGLFSTTSDLLKFAAMLMDGGKSDGRRLLEEKMVEAMHTNQLEAIGARAGLGWAIGNAQSFGTAGSAETFGKTGFTGTMVLIDPAKQVALSVLSNRTYPHTPESYEPMRAVWRGLADLVLGD